jgi:hypothetical protein
MSDDLSGARGAIVELATSLIGKAADDEDGVYVELIAPSDIESTARAHEMAKESGCGLVVRGLWRRAGLDHPILAAPYRDTHAISDVVQIANDHGALRPRSDWGSIAPGDVVIVDGDKPDVHMFTVVAVSDVASPTLAVVSVDGGQRLGAMRVEGVLEIHRVFDEWFVDHRQTPPQSSRKVTHVIDCDALFFVAP